MIHVPTSRSACQDRAPTARFLKIVRNERFMNAQVQKNKMSIAAKPQNTSILM